MRMVTGIVYWTNNSRKSEERDLILSLIFGARQEVHLGVNLMKTLGLIIMKGG